jgi:FdhE protein
MSDESTQSQVTERIEKALARTRESLPALANVLDAFKHLLLATAVFKSGMVQDEAFVMPGLDAERFRQGVPLATKETFRISEAQRRTAAKEIGPAIAKGFPRISADVTAISAALDNGTLDGEPATSAILHDRNDEIDRLALNIAVDPAVLKFVLYRFLKPFVEKRAEWMGHTLEKLEWTKGYCPVCGSWASVSFLKGVEGQRWLKCSFCGHEWRFMRMACPFCENEDQDKLELFFSEDRQAERVEACHHCKRYVLGIDLRERADEPVMDVIPLGLVYLDVLAQQQGFKPGASTLADISSIK